MKLKNQQILELKSAVEQLGAGQHVFSAQVTYRIARHLRKLKSAHADIDAVRLSKAKELQNKKEDPAAPLVVQADWENFLKEESEVDVEANLSAVDLNIWDKTNADGNKIPATLLATLEPLLLE